MVPVKPFRLCRLIVDRAEEPLERVIDEGLTVMLKSPVFAVPMLTVTVV